MVRGLILTAMLAASSLLCGQAPTLPVTSPPPADEKPVPCSASVSAICSPTKASRKQAEKHFHRAQNAQKKGHLRQAFEEFSQAVNLSPDSISYISSREFARQQLARQLIDGGNRQMLDGKTVPALASFREALEVDPGNEFAKQRIYDAMPPLPAVRVVQKQAAELIHLKPLPIRRHVVLQGPVQMALESMAQSFGVTAFIDPSVPVRTISLTLDNVTWEEAAALVCRVTRTFWSPIATNQVLFAAADDATRRALQRMGLATYYVSANTPQELTDLTNTLRVLFDIRFIVADPAQSTITVRAPQPIIEAASQFLEQLEARRPQVVIDVYIYAVARDLAKEVGTDIPNSFGVFNVPTEAQKLLGGQSIQSVINQLIANGGINQAATAGIAGLLAQALSGNTSVFSSPFLTFGGGATLTGISVPAYSARLNVNESTMHSLQHVTVRASQGNAATIKIGQRYPIMNASYAPIFNNAAISSVIANGSYRAPFPSISYEDLGVNLKATPRVSRAGVVTVEFEMQIRALQGTSVNGVPILSNREFKGSVSTPNGESICIAGLISKSEQRSLAGVPLLSSIPLAGAIFTDRNRNKNDDEVLVVMTPHIVGGPPLSASPIITLPSFIQR